MAARSAFLISSQFAFTSAADDTDTEPNTCGCRRTSFAASVSATSSMVKPPSAAGRSAAILAWKNAWNMTSPISSRSAARSPVSIVSAASYASSSRYRSSDACVCSRSHGQETRSVSMIDTRSSRCAPGRSCDPFSTWYGTESDASSAGSAASPGGASHTTAASADDAADDRNAASADGVG